MSGAERARGRGPRRLVVIGSTCAAVALMAVALTADGRAGSRPRHGVPASSHDRDLTTPRSTRASSCAGAEAPGACSAPESDTGCTPRQQPPRPCPPPPTTTTPSPPTTTSTSTAPTATTPPGPQQASACAGTTPPIASPSGSWRCSFDDEFSGTSLDTTKWQPQLTSTSGYSTGPLFSQVCYVDNTNTISESGGDLSLSVTAVSPPVNCAQAGNSGFTTSYEGGMIDSYQRFSQEYGYFQVRAEMLPASVPGLQETLWLYPENLTLYGPWPDSGEIDYAEFFSNYPTADVPTFHYPGSVIDPNATAATGCHVAGDTTAGQFNTYALSWTPTTLTTYFNGVPCITDVYAPYVAFPDTAPQPFNQPFFLAFTAAFGMSGGDTFIAGTTPLPATTKIDWVRAWQY
jgi:beta-glucanase (GH16 family)